MQRTHEHQTTQGDDLQKERGFHPENHMNL